MRHVRHTALVAAAAAAIAACGDSTSPPTPHPTSITLSATTVGLAALGATQQLTATVKDQNGQTMSGQTITWSAANTGIATVSTGGLVTAVANGQTQVAATSGTLSASATVTVAQVVATLAKTGGDAQTGSVNAALATAIEVEARDARGHALTSGATAATVNFAVTQGGGSVGQASVVVGASGRASTTWTLGTTAGTGHQVTATHAGGTATATFSATAVAGSPSAMVKVSGDAQSGAINAALTDSIVVRVNDQFGNPVSSYTVDFVVTSGGGSPGPASQATGADGRAATRWTLGGTVGGQTLEARASTAISGTPAVFTATATELASGIAKSAGDDQTATVNTAVATAPAVLVTNSGGSPMQGVTVVFSIAGGGGHATDTVKVSDASGIATVGSWTLGTTAGANTLSATTQGLAPVVFTATGTAGAAAALVIADGNNQIGLVDAPVNVRPAVLVQDQYANAVAGASVTFQVTGGGGSVTGSPATSDTTGTARVGSWRLGVSPGANALEASSGALTPASFTATGQTAAFSIEVRYYGGTVPSASQQAAFTAAATRWGSIVFGDIQNFPVSIDLTQCGDTLLPKSFSETVDDALIFAKVDAIDGVGNILGRAGPCVYRSGGTNPGLPIIGIMIFDEADLGLMTNEQLGLVVTHEMGHVLGYGTYWNLSNIFSLLVGAGGSDPHFVGARGLAAFDDVGGATYVAGAKVPVENTGGAGTRDGHWRETVFGSELMTGWINLGQSNPLSVVTAASLWDMGYTVNYSAADGFSLSAGALRVGAGASVHLKDDIRRGPVFSVTPDGRVTRVR